MAGYLGMAQDLRHPGWSSSLCVLLAVIALKEEDVVCRISDVRRGIYISFRVRLLSHGDRAQSVEKGSEQEVRRERS